MLTTHSMEEAEMLCDRCVVTDGMMAYSCMLTRGVWCWWWCVCVWGVCVCGKVVGNRTRTCSCLGILISRRERGSGTVSKSHSMEETEILCDRWEIGDMRPGHMSSWHQVHSCHKETILSDKHMGGASCGAGPSLQRGALDMLSTCKG